MLFYRVFSMLRFLCSFSFHFLPLYIFRTIFRIYSRGFPVLYMAAPHSRADTDADLEREGGVESGRLDVPHFDLGLSLSLLPSDITVYIHYRTMDIHYPGVLATHPLASTFDSHPPHSSPQHFHP